MLGPARTSGLALSLAALLGAGCSRGSARATLEAEAPTAAATVTGASSRATPEAGSVAAGADAAAPRWGDYVAALARGRKATTARHYAAAIAAFDEAAGVVADDARAPAERGYARLLSGDLPAASQDLDTASSLTRDPVLLAQIWFNRGLVDDKLGKGDEAQADFAVSNHLRPTAAARSKLGAKDACPVRIDGSWEASPKPGIEGPDWLALWQATDVGRNADAQPKTSDEVLEQVGASQAPDGPVVAVFGQQGSAGRSAYLVARQGATLGGMLLGSEVGGRCPGDLEFEILEKRGSLVHVHGTELPEGGYAFMCLGPGDDQEHPCTESETAPAFGRQSYCAGGTPTEHDWVVDLATWRVLVSVERPALADPLTKVTATILEGGVSIAGLGCDRVVRFGADAGHAIDASTP